MSSPIRISDLDRSDHDAVRLVAALFVKVGRRSGNDALRIVKESFAPRSLSRIAFSEAGAMLGWYSAREQPVGKLWERRGAVIDTAVEVRTFADVWRAFADDLEEQARARGGAAVESLRRLNARPGEIFTREQAARHLTDFISCLRRVSTG